MGQDPGGTHPPWQVREEEAARRPEEAGGSGTVLGREGAVRVRWGQRPGRAVRKSFRGEVMKSRLLRE